MPKAAPQTLRDTLLSYFPPDLALLLLEYSKHIAALDADYLIFMARKSLRLYDFLLLIGGPINQRPILSDHVLDQSLERFRGKRVCLVDDTLILGTTLAEAKKTLLAAGAAEVTCHVFAIDKENWCRDLLVPEKFFAELDHQRMLTLCAREVLALSAAAIPYLSDFPFSERIRLTEPRLTLLHSLPGWDTHTLTTASQRRANVATYSLLPAQDTIAAISDSVGTLVFDLIELIKLRVFCRYAAGAYWARLVPIVTLKPVASETVEALFEKLLQHLEKLTQKNFTQVKHCLTTSISKLRFVQYALSLIVGHTFTQSFREYSGVKTSISFDINEGARLFGPWLHNELQQLHQITGTLLKTPLLIDAGLQGRHLVESDLPADVVDTSKSEYRSFVRRQPDLLQEGQSHSALNRFADLVTAFVGLHKKYEIPARQEVHKHGRNLFDLPPSKVPYRERLKFGFAWRALVDCLLEGQKIKPSLPRANALSLLLDQLIDLGIAVPLLCAKSGILFRAYRYGEDVTFGDQELALAHEVVAGFLDGSKRSDIAHVRLEKLLVSLLRVGVAKEFLHIVHDLSGSDGVARIGFHLHGAVPMLSGPDTIYADDEDSWLSRYMIDREILKFRKPKRSTSRGSYELGVKPEASYLKPQAASEARQLGLLMGLLSSEKGANKKVLLGEAEMIILASCIRPKDTTAAVGAELRQLIRWYDRHGQRLKRIEQWRDGPELADTANKLVRGTGYLAINSARMKLDAHWAGGPAKIIEACSKHLATLPNGTLLEAIWNGDWSPVLAEVSVEERQKFEPWISQLATEVLVAAAGVHTVELALLTTLAHGGGNVVPATAYADACEKIEGYINALIPKTDLGAREQRVLAHLLDVCRTKSPMMNAESAFEFGHSWLAGRLPAMRALTHQIEQVTTDFGKADKRINFSSLLWYDIIDSTGQKSRLNGDALKQYRQRVRRFKDAINREVYGLRRDAGRSGGIVHAWQGPLDSKDDEKHIFFAGTRNVGWLTQALKILLSTARANDVCVRVIALRADFAGIAAHKYATSSNVDGESFWEHLSRLKPQIKDVEVEMKSNPLGQTPRHSFFWAVGDFARTLDTSGSAKLPNPRELDVTTAIGDINLTMHVRGGEATHMR